jgi:hypothetical protein
MMLTHLSPSCHHAFMPYNEIKRPKSAAAIKKLFQKIAEKTGVRPEVALSLKLDIGPFAPRMWLDRGIPEGYWPTVAALAGVPVEEVAAAHQWIARKSKFHRFPDGV